MSASFERQFMASNKHLGPGIINFAPFFFSQASKILMLTLFYFFLTTTGHIIYLLVYMDDLIIIGDSTKLVDSCVATLAHRFSIKDLGQLAYFLGVKIVSN
jgi:hypothetical protein